MKICIICQDLYSLGGVQKTVVDIIRFLIEKKGDSFDVIMPFVNVDDLFDIPKDVRIINLNTIYKKKKSILWGINRRISIFNNRIFAPVLDKIMFGSNEIEKFSNYLNNNKYDCIIGVADEYSLLVSKMADKLHSKTIGWMHSTFKGYYQIRGHASYGAIALNRKYMHKLNKVFVLNSSDKEIYDNEFNVHSTVMYNSIKVVQPISDKANLYDLLYVGRINIFVKGMDLLIDILEKTIRSLPNCKICIVGSGSKSDELAFEKEIIKRNLQANIKIEGYKKNVSYYYKVSKLLLSTSRWEGFGVSIVEAMNYGVPCISFFNDGPKDIIETEINGILVKKYDTNTFSNKIIECLQDKKKYDFLSKNAIERSRMFSIEQIGEEFRKNII